MESTQTFQSRAFSIKLWPPSQSTRLMLVERMTKNLSSPPLFSRKYGLLSKEEAEENAKKIEEVAFAVANQHYEKEPDGDGSFAVQLYAKESSELMLEVLNRGLRPKEEGEVPVPGPNKVFDISRGPRVFIQAEEAEKIIKPLTETSAPSLEVLEMVGNEITIGAAGPLAECITVKQFLTKLNLSENELKDQGSIIIGKALEEGHPHLKEVDLSTNTIRRAGARVLAHAVVGKPDFVLLNINGNFISDEGIDEVKEILKANKKSVDVLGPLDENDPEGEDEDAKSEEDEGAEDKDELELKLQDLKVDHE